MNWEDMKLAEKEERAERMARQTNERTEYAINQFEHRNIRYKLKNEANAHFHCFRKSDGKLFQFWARTGKILGSDKRGIRSLIKILEEGD